MLAMLGELKRETVEEIADALAESLDWDAGRRRAEAARTFEILADRHGVRL
jgi:hypothetical protein